MKKKANPRTFGIVLFLMIFSAHLSPLCAQNENPDSLGASRLQFLCNTLKHDQANTRRWWYGWLGVYSAATIGQGAVYLSSNDKGLRQDMALGAATTLLGMAGQFITPLIPYRKAELLDKMPSASRSDSLRQLAFAEQLLKEYAIREKLARSWKTHAICSAVNLGGGLITWLGFKRSIGAGVGYFVLNSVITETQIWTQPVFAKRSYQKYRAEYLAGEPVISYRPEVNWYMNAYPGGMGIRMVF